MSWDDIIKGTSGSDIINGGSGDDFLQGRAGGDFLDGGDGNDELQGNDGDDYLRGAAGNDFLHGGTGTDTAVYSGSIKDYSYSRPGNSNTEFFISHTGGSMIDGYDRLISVERLIFADAVIDLTQNNAPIAFSDVASTDEDVGTYSSGSASVLDNDFDWENNNLTATAGTFTGVYGTLVLNSDGTYTYTPFASTQSLDTGETVQDSFTYTVSDGSLSDTGTLTITISGVNDAPVANDDAASTSEDASVSGNVLANDTDVDGETLTVANPGVYVGANGTLTLNADGSYTYVPNAAAQGLDTGESVQDVFSYTASDGTASDSATLTITVNGANDAPVANDDSASVSEDAASVSGNVLANDTDVDGETLTVSNPGIYVGAYGTLTLNSDGSYTYVPNAAAQGLDTGESVQDVFNYTATDGTASDSATLTITVNGANDAPVANDDTASTSEDGNASGNVLANDTDVDGETLTVSNPGVYVGAYGTLTLNSDGSYTYVPNAAAQGLDTGESVQDVFNYTATDGTASDSATLTITVNGANDAPVANDDSASVSEDAANVSGNVLANDTDVDGEALTVTNPGTYVGSYGTLTLNADGSYTYVTNAAAQGLDTGETANDVFNYTASDGTASDSATLTITVNGANDAPVANDDTATTDEDTNVSGNVLTNDTDVDGEALTIANPGVYNGTYGTLTLNADGSYTYVTNAAAQALNAGDVVNDVFNYTASDGTASDSATLTITVNGLADGPQTVWYIDNSAVGSTNVGTQANPFTSIASFNAAQGQVGGPQDGATVYLLQGTGTYAEADGINLLDDQILIGVGQPTIAATAGSGIDLADNNNVSGVDIVVSAGNVGIQDDGAGVGNLVVSDVAIAGAGQIVDLDTGGTLNVQLNSAASTASTGGAIDLNAVGGSFSVTGATTIAGATGGGVDVTSGVNLAVAFQGGLTASSGASTAVNFSGNMGSSSLAVAGLNLTTTTGTGLNVTNGGTVTVTGPGNTIATTGGTAVNIAFATIGGGGVTLQSVTSLGGSADGIILNTAGSGGFTVTGTGSTAGSGGTIANKTGLDGVAPGQGVGVYINATSNVSLANMSITGNSNGGIVGTNVVGFNLTDSTLTNNGTSATEGAVAISGLTGTSALLGNVIAGSSGNNVNISASAGILNLTIDDSASDQAIIGTTNNVIGGDGIKIATSGTATMTLLIDGVDFQGARSDLLEISALGSSTQHLLISNNNFTNGQATSLGGGVVLTGGGAGSDIDVDYRVEDNLFTGAVGSAFTGNYFQQAGTVLGYISGNTIGVDDGSAGTEGSSGGGDGIVVGLEKFTGAGDATYQVIIANNDIHDIDAGLGGIIVRSSKGTATDTATMEAIIHDNVVDELGANTLAAVYTLVGGNGPGDFSKLGLEMDDNVFDASNALLNAVYLDQASDDANYYFPGYTGSSQGEFHGTPGTASADIGAYLTGRGNVLTDGAFATFPGTGVDAGIVDGVANAMLLPAWYP